MAIHIRLGRNSARLARCLAGLALFGLLFGLPSSTAQGAEDTLIWNTNANRVSADIQGLGLVSVLERVAAATGWKVFVEPETLHPVRTKFKDLEPGDALRRLLGDVNFALVPETNSSSRLLVFRTSMGRATQVVRAPKAVKRGKVIENELIVRVKPGTDIEALAKALGARVSGKIDSLNAYRLVFDDSGAANAARSSLSTNSDVTNVDNNYVIERPNPDQGLAPGSGPPHLTLKAPPDDGRIIVGLIDTAVQPLGNNLDSFLLKQLSVAGEANLDPDSPSHGTSMAETILRSLADATKGFTAVQILPVDVYGPNASTSTFDVANGIALAVKNGARVLNLSLGSEGDSAFLRDVIQQANKLGIALFAAAGNVPDTREIFPAAYPEVNAVTAIDHGQIASYANRGAFVTLGAPGTSYVNFNRQTYSVMGTSTASAFASGFAAGYLDSTHGTLTAMQQYMKNNFGISIRRN